MKTFYILFALALGLVFTSCKKDEEQIENGVLPTEAHRLEKLSNNLKKQIPKEAKEGLYLQMESSYSDEDKGKYFIRLHPNFAGIFLEINDKPVTKEDRDSGKYYIDMTKPIKVKMRKLIQPYDQLYKYVTEHKLYIGRHKDMDTDISYGVICRMPDNQTFYIIYRFDRMKKK
ncbi:hypothetical protein [Capnocytophaga canimorsus]|uniref:hypothetical protein n=1 Tax=Capnocytophaga canimorsus TaxID=28188 RepID=UPI001EDDABED|nr:hypothetical protein [Capnocytophaga canimorsus]GJQ05379.1 hypothetical protein CAPN009_17940 [Capnocytophaga canimorsus]